MHMSDVNWIKSQTVYILSYHNNDIFIVNCPAVFLTAEYLYGTDGFGLFCPASVSGSAPNEMWVLWAGPPAFAGSTTAARGEGWSKCSSEIHQSSTDLTTHLLALTLDACGLLLFAVAAAVWDAGGAEKFCPGLLWWPKCWQSKTSAKKQVRHKDKDKEGASPPKQRVGWSKQFHPGVTDRTWVQICFAEPFFVFMWWNNEPKYTSLWNLYLSIESNPNLRSVRNL